MPAPQAVCPDRYKAPSRECRPPISAWPPGASPAVQGETSRRGPARRERRGTDQIRADGILAIFFQIEQGVADRPRQLRRDCSSDFSLQTWTIFQYSGSLVSGVDDRPLPAAARIDCVRVLELEEVLDDAADLALQFAPLRFAQPLDLLRQVLPIESLVRAGAAARPQRFGLLLRPGDKILIVKRHWRVSRLRLGREPVVKNLIRGIGGAAHCLGIDIVQFAVFFEIGDCIFDAAAVFLTDNAAELGPQAGTRLNPSLHL